MVFRCFGLATLVLPLVSVAGGSKLAVKKHEHIADCFNHLQGRSASLQVNTMESFTDLNNYVVLLEYLVRKTCSANMAWKARSMFEDKWHGQIKTILYTRCSTSAQLSKPLVNLPPCGNLEHWVPFVLFCLEALRLFADTDTLQHYLQRSISKQQRRLLGMPSSILCPAQLWRLTRRSNICAGEMDFCCCNHKGLRCACFQRLELPHGNLLQCDSWGMMRTRFADARTKSGVA